VTQAASGDEPVRDEELGLDLHDGPGQLVTAIHLLAHRYADELPEDSPWRDRFLRLVTLARQAKWDMDRIARGLAISRFIEEDDRDPLERLAAQLQADSGITMLHRIRGGPPMDAAETTTLLRIAHLALMNAWRHSRCKAIRIEVLLRRAEIVLSVSDDGVGLGRRWEFREGRLGMGSMRRSAERAGGSLSVRANSPHGLTVEARIPRGTRS
jgi:signal transduction histidine kinase